MPDVRTNGIPIPEKEDAFMQENQRCFMLTIRKDGSPTGHPMAGFYGEGLWLNMYKISQKAVNLRRNPSICCLMTTASDEPNFRAVLYKGHTREMTPEETAKQIVPGGVARARDPKGQSEERAAQGRPNAGNPEDPEEAQARLNETAARVAAGKRILFEVVPDDIRFLENTRGG